MIFSDNQPIYIQIMNSIKNRIVSGELKGGDKLPSVRELSTKYKVNPNTIQRSYQELERENLVYTQRGMGTFVTEDIGMIKNLKKDMAHNIIHNFIKDMNSLGYSSEEIIEFIKESARRENQ